MPHPERSVSGYLFWHSYINLRQQMPRFAESMAIFGDSAYGIHYRLPTSAWASVESAAVLTPVYGRLTVCLAMYGDSL